MKHRKTGHAYGWSGTPEELVQVAREGQRILRSASGGNHGCTFTVSFKSVESRYKTPDEFLAELAPSEIAHARTISILYSDRKSGLGASVRVYRRSRRLGPFISVEGDERSLVEGVAKRLVDTFSSGQNKWWPGMRLYRPGETSRLSRLRARAGSIGLIVMTAVVIAVITVVVTKLLS